MEEPLLGSLKRAFSYLNPIPEHAPLEEEEKEEARNDEERKEEDEEAILSSSPSTIKERLIFGSTEQCLFPWLDRSRIPEQLSFEEEKQENDVKDHESLKESDDNTFDDSFVDNEVMGSLKSGLKSQNDLTRLDLDIVPETSKQQKEVSFSSDTSNVLDYETEKKEKEANKCYHTIDMYTDSDTSDKSNSNDFNALMRKQLRRIKTAPALTTKTGKPRNELATKQKPETAIGLVVSPSSSMSVVSQAFIGLLLYLAVGVVIYSFMEDEFSGSSTHYVIDAIYFCIVTMCTIGYGDITPVTPLAKIFSCVFVLVGFGFIDILLSGMVCYVLDKQEALLLSSVSSGQHDVARNYLVDTKKGRMRIRSKVALAFGVVVMCIGVGAVVMHFLESLCWLDSFYLSCMSVTTVGYGDHAFKTISGRLFASVWLLVSTLAVARSVIFLAEAQIDKRHRLIAKFMLEKEMTLGDLVAADLDNDGCVSKSDFVVYKLKQMGKIVEKDIAEVCRQFNRLDTDNSGKITLSCLIKLHEASVSHKDLKT